MLKFIQKQKTRLFFGVLLPISLVSAATGYLIYDYKNVHQPATIKEQRDSKPFTSIRVESDGKNVVKNIAEKITAPAGEKIAVTTSETKPAIHANAVAYEWNQSGKTGVSAEVRTKTGDKWTGWTDLEVIDGGKDGTDTSNRVSALVLANQIDKVQFKFLLEGSDAMPSDSISLGDSSLTAIDSTQGPSGHKSLIERTLSFVSPTASADTAAPRIITRAEWGSPQPDWSDWPPEYAPLTRTIVHHTATTASGDSYADVRAIWQYHARNLEWGDIGYHYLIDSNGQIFQGRYFDQNTVAENKVEVIGGHAYNNNRGTIGISVIGNYTATNLSSPAYQSLINLIGYKMARYNISPSGDGPVGQAVVGHYQVTQTSCPGNGIISRLDEIRNQSNEYAQLHKPNVHFIPLSSPVWMELNKDASKRNPDTMSTQGSPLIKGTQLKFVDRGYRNGVWYYRTEYDALNDLNKGIHEGSISKIPNIPLSSPTYMELTSDRIKWSPTTGHTLPNVIFKQGAVVKVSDKIVLNGVEYYRTEYDSQRDNPWYFTGSALGKPTFKQLIAPLYLSSQNGSLSYIDPLTQSAGPTVQNQEIVKFSYYMTLDKKYLQTDSDKESGSSLGVPQNTLTNKYTYSAINIPQESRYILVADTYKQSLDTLQPTSVLLKKGSVIQLADRVTIDGNVYLRTEYDSKNANPYGIKESTIRQLTYASVPLLSREVKVPTSKIDPVSLATLGGQIATGTRLTLSSSTTIDGVLYYRTQYDTEHNLDKVIRSGDLQ